MKKLTDFEKRTGWRYSITAANIRHQWGIADSHQVRFLDALHRDRAEVEDCVRTNKTMGVANLPSTSWDVNTGWTLAANLACDLDTWLRLLTLHDHDELTDAEPQPEVLLAVRLHRLVRDAQDARDTAVARLEFSQGAGAVAQPVGQV